MAQVRISDLYKEYRGNPPTVAANNLSMDIEDGEFLVLLGPSGCGKSTTLRCLAGLETPDRGEIEIGGKVAFSSFRGHDLPPDKRDIGMVFQSYALWPHMTVKANVEYPLRARKLQQGLAQGWADETIKLVGCEELVNRYPGQLSGGQQQRVALARGLVARPGLMLFDEPLSNLDARLRDRVRSQLHELHSRLGFTAVFVTHDQTEALSLADRIAIMRKGSVEQLDTVQRVFEEPATEYVADFLGMTEALALEVVDGQWLAESAHPVDGNLTVLDTTDRVLTARVRTQDLYVRSAGAHDPNQLSVECEVVDVAYAGRYYEVAVSVGGKRLLGRTPVSRESNSSVGLAPGDRATLQFDIERAAFYDKDGKRVRLRRSCASVTPMTRVAK